MPQPKNPANHGFFRYRIGDAALTALHDGTARRLLEGLFRNVGVDDARQALAEAGLPTDAATFTFTPLLIEHNGELTLIDTGLGDLGGDTTGFMLENLAAVGYARADVRNIVISHFHGDHINGLRRKDGTENFPHARVFVPQAEWDFWMTEAAETPHDETVATHRKNAGRVFAAMADRVEKFDAGAEILPGLTALAAPGHTPGHTAFRLHSGGASLLIMSDIANLPALFVRHPEWSPVFDIIPDLALTTRMKFLTMAAEEKVQTAFFHAPFPATGFIEKAQGGFRFMPVEKV